MVFIDLHRKGSIARARLKFVDLSRWMEMINNVVGVGTYDCTGDTDIGAMLSRSGAAGQLVVGVKQSTISTHVTSQYYK